MNLMNELLKIAGKNNLKIDDQIDNKYIFSLCWEYGWMMLRGKLFSFANKKISNDVFLGKRVKVKKKKNIKIGKKVKLHDGVYMDALSTQGIQLGDGVIIGANSKIQCTGSLSYLGKGIRIGDYTTFGNDCFFGAAGGIEIGKNVVAGQYIRFHSENHNYSNADLLIKDQGVTHIGIKIGNNCWIGSGAVFLDGAEVGDGCVVAANAVVTKKFANDIIIGGIPAKEIKKRI